MRASPAVRRAPVHQFADGAAKHVPKRSVAQALNHEVAQNVESADVSGEFTHEQFPPDATHDVAPSSIAAISASIFDAPTPKESTASVALRAVTTEDVDLLWDWSRSDAEGVKAFLGHELKNSRELFTAIGRLAQLEISGVAWMQTITRDESVIGFVLVCPIQRTKDAPPVGTVHLYVAPHERGDLASVVSAMLADFDAKQEPITLSVIVTRPEWARVLEPLGFQSSTVLTRPALVRSDGVTR